MSSRQSVPIIAAITEVDSPFEKEQDYVSDSTQRSRRISTLFEEIIVPDQSVCRLLLDIISKDEHMTKESAHFILSEHQLIRVIAYTFDVVENQVSLNVEDEGCCGKFMHDDTRTLRDITINNVNILTLDIDKVNLLRDSYKLCLQKVRKITSILDLGDISSKLMSAASKGFNGCSITNSLITLNIIFDNQIADADLHSLDVLLIHDEILFRNVRHNTVGLIDQVTNINNQIYNINNATAPDVYIAQMYLSETIFAIMLFSDNTSYSIMLESIILQYMVSSL
ncbi:MAG: hypothetical protein EZS28_044808 [Streblomastix strix]|uniref:Uncharacterized protein n=1 Tax=Streblomastix strix TaxID=222440 RepID=A0A5J4TQM3_9EUKA|nr:MAG: hypothetical protein EZS28_044808 [Streblomastix strix]